MGSSRWCYSMEASLAPRIGHLLSKVPIIAFAVFTNDLHRYDIVAVRCD
jgi:hypothetical protein